METFHLSLQEIRERFTTSELVMMGWRSQEQSYNMKKRMNKDYEEPSVNKSTGKHRKQYDGIGPERMPDDFFAQKDIKDERGRLIANAGDFNLGQVKGEQARQYFERVLRIPMPPNIITKIRDESEASQQIREVYKIRG